MRVGVVGAGISGLVTVHALAAAHVDVVALEARDEAGGTVRSRRVDGHVVELGPQRLRLTPEIESLVDELGLADRLQVGDADQPIHVLHDGALHVAPLSVREALTTDLLDWRGKLRVLAEPLHGPPRPGESVDDYLVRAFGEQAARRFLGPLYSGLYGTHPGEMPVEYSLGRALRNAGIEGSVLPWALRKVLAGREPPPIVTFETGLQELPERLAEVHADAVDLGTPVTALREGTDGYDVETDEGVETVDEVVFTTPAETCATVLEPLDADAAATLRRFNYNPITVVALESDFDGTGIGVIVPPESDARVSGFTWNASFLDRDRLFTCYLDATSLPGMVDHSNVEIGQVAAEEFERLTGAAATPIHVHRWDPGMPAYDRSWRAMEDLDLPDGVHLCTSFVDRPGIPGRVRHARRLADSLADR